METERRIDWLFAKLHVMYGSLWPLLWAGLDMGVVKNEWELGLQNTTNDALEYGLDHLSADKPPNLQQFKAACSRWTAGYVALPRPKPTDEQKAYARRIVEETRARIAASRVS